jgi:hypothetical protein
MNRRDFIKKTGMASVALASLPTVITALTNVAPASAADEGINFTLVGMSDAATGPFTGDSILVNGGGRFAQGAVQGGGSFTHFTPPSTLKASGTWKARKFVSFTPAGSLGAHMGGELVIGVDLVPASGTVVPATLTIRCHGFGGPAPEGTDVAVDGSVFLTHKPPPASATLFSIGVVERN